MSSPTTDNYAGLMTPWKPVADPVVKENSSNSAKIKPVPNIREGDITQKDKIGTRVRISDDAQLNNLGTSIVRCNNTDIDGDEITKSSAIFYLDGTFNVGVKTLQGAASSMQDLGTAAVGGIDVDSSIVDGALNDGAEVTDTDNGPSQLIDPKCMAVSTCVANSGDHRKVVSHVFGRNKSCTRELPDNLWIFWCRKHYQRFKYRAEDSENWHTIQLGLVRKQLQIFQDWGEVRSWTIALRKAEHDALAKENNNGLAYTNHISSCWERFLVPYLGPSKTYAQVRHVLEVIEFKFSEAEYRNRDKKLKTFPGVEFLPTIQKANEAKKPIAKKGEVTYRKITLDQPVFSRKTRANSEYLKDMAAKKADLSKSPSTASKKSKSPDIHKSRATVERETSPSDNETDDPAEFEHNSVNNIDTTGTPSKGPKRKSMTPVPVPVHQTPPSHPHKALPIIKRRRLTRGYEKHGSSDPEDGALMIKKEQGASDEL